MRLPDDYRDIITALALGTITALVLVVCAQQAHGDMRVRGPIPLDQIARPLDQVAKPLEAYHGNLRVRSGPDARTSIGPKAGALDALGGLTGAGPLTGRRSTIGPKAGALTKVRGPLVGRR